MATRFDVEKTSATLKNFGFESRRTSTGLVVQSQGVETLIDVESVSVTAMDRERVSEVVRITRPLNGEVMDAVLTPGFTAEWNRLAALNMTLQRQSSRPAMLASRISVYEGDDDAATHLYPWLVAAAAHMSLGVENFMQPGSPGLSDYVRGMPAPGPEWFGMGSNANASPRYVEASFADARRWATKNRFASASDPTGVTLELPWDTGAVTSAFVDAGYADHIPDELPEDEKKRIRALAGRTILVTASTTEAHPLFGRGLLALMRLPFSLEQERCWDAVNRLNEWELASVDLSPSLGAWSIDRQGTSPAYACFLPNAFEVPNFPLLVVTWMVQRAWRARHWLREQGIATWEGD